MKHFFIKTVIFFVLIIVTYNSVHFLLFEYFRKDIYPVEDYKWVHKISVDPKIVLMGSSTMKYHVSPGIITSKSRYRSGEIINIANDAKSPIQNYYIYKSVEKKLAPDAKVFYGIDPWIFSRDFYYLDPLVVNRLHIKDRLYFINKLKQNRHWYMLGGNFLYHFRRFLGLDKVVNQIPPDYGAKKLFPMKIVHFNKDFFYFTRLGYSNLQFQYIKKLKDDVEKRGGEFVIVIPPKCRKWVMDYLKYSVNADRLFVKFMNEVVGKVKVVGSFYSLPEGKDEKYFKDSVHLNREGMKLYSYSVLRFLNNIGGIKEDYLKPLNLYQ